MELASLLKEFDTCVQEGRPFVLYALPNEMTLTGLLQKTNIACDLEEYTKEGFLFAPFDNEQKTYFIASDSSQQVTVDGTKFKHISNSFEVSHQKQEQTNYISLVNNAIDKVQDSKIKKVVVSRKKEIALTHFNLEKLINTHFTSYTNTFRYLWYHPETHYWCGATPETLVKLRENEFTTMALAGTKKAMGDLSPEWTPKEYYEQQIVTDAIYDVLNNLTPVLKISKPYNHKSGNLYHIRTDVTGVMRNSNAKLNKILKALHPTPAVCGMPKVLTQKYISNTEGYDRSFYTGYLGPVLKDGIESHLFVNLRCMQLTPTLATIFVGGGIVPDSIAEKEWEETCLKMQPMANLIGSML